MSSPDSDGLSTESVDSDAVHSQDPLRSADVERSSPSFQQSPYFDDTSEDIMSAGSRGGRGLDSAELLSASDKKPCSSGSENTTPHAVSHQVEIKAETSTNKRRLRMMDEDSDGVRIKIIPCVKEQLRQRIAATKVLGDDFYVPNRHNSC